MADLRDMLIVIADDDPDDIAFVVDALKDNNIRCKVFTVKNGQELLNLLFGKDDDRMMGMKPDLIILDINMHILDGLAALEKIKADEELKKLPVYILSTSIHPGHVQKAAELGATKYYKKPAQYSDLKKLVKEVCLEAL